MEVWANDDKDNASSATVIATANIFATADIYWERERSWSALFTLGCSGSFLSLDIDGRCGV
jgi:hypothetical protein